MKTPHPITVPNSPRRPSKLRRCSPAICCASIALLAAGATARAASGTWTDILSGGLWSDTLNWSGGIIGDGSTFTADFTTLDITSDITVHLDTARTISNLTFGDINTTSAAGWTIDNNGNAADILTLGAAPTITVNGLGTNKKVTISAIIAGTNGMTKAGAGTLLLSGANTYTGTTSIGAGTVQIGNASALGATRVNLASGATLDLNGSNLKVDFLNNGSSGSVFAGGVVDNVSAGGNVTLTVGGNQGGVSATNTNYQSLDSFSGVIQNTTGTIGLTKIAPSLANQPGVGIIATSSNLNGANVLRLTNQNTYTGATTVKGGYLDLFFGQSNNGGAAVGSNIISASSALVLAGGAIVMDSTTSGATSNQTFASLTLNAGGSHIANYRATSGSGITTLNLITRNVGSTVNFQDRPQGSSSNGKLGAADGTVTTKTANANFTGGTATILGGYATANGITWAVSAGTGAASGAISGLASYSATMAAGSNVDVPTAGLSSGGPLTVNSLRFLNTTAGATNPYNVTLGGDLIVATGGLLTAGSSATAGSPSTANASITGNFNLTSGNGQDLIFLTSNLGVAGLSVANMSVTSNITNNGVTSIGLTKGGAGTLTLTPATANTFTGQVSINAGTVILGNANALNGNDVVFGGSSEIHGANIGTGNGAGSFLVQNGTLTLSGNNASVASLTSSADSSGTAIVQNASASPATLTVNGTTSTTFAGTVQDGTGGGALSLTKSGSSTLTLLNTTYTGNTTVNGGTLVMKTSINASPNVTVASTATLNLTAVAGGLTVGSTKTLSGSGSLLGGATISTGGNLTPGTAGTVGSLTLDTVTLSTGSVMNFDLASAVSNDSVTVTGSNGLTINGGGFALSGAAVNASGTTFNLFQYSGAIQGTGVSAFSVISGGIGGLTYTFADDTTNHRVTLTIGGSLAQISAWGVNLDGSWGTAGNWSPAVIPQNAGDTANFTSAISAPHTVTLDGNRSVGAINFDNANAYTIAQGTSGTLTLDNGAGAVNVTVVSGSHTVSAPVTLASNTIFAVTNAPSTLTISGAVDGNGSLTKNGNGTLVLSSPNTFIGGATLTAGTLEFVSNGLGTTGSITLGGGTLRYATGNTDDLSIRGITVAGQTAIDTNGNDVGLFSAFGGSGSGGLTKVGSGKLTLGAGNTFTGGTILKAGTLVIFADTALGAVPGSPATKLTFDPGAGNDATLQAFSGFTLNANRNVSLASGTAIFDTNGQAVTVAGAISGTGVLNKIGTGTLTLSSAGSNYGGGTKVDGGTLTVASAGSSAALGTGSVTLNNAAILNLGARNLSQPLIVNGTNGLLSGDNGGVSGFNVVTGAGTLSITISGANVDVRGDLTGFTGTIASVSTGTLRFNGTTGGSLATFDLGSSSAISIRSNAAAINLGALVGNAGSLLGGSSSNATTLIYTIGAKNLSTTFAGNIVNGSFSGTTTGINKVGTGSLTLSGSNTYSGMTTATLGTLIAASNSALGSSIATTAGLNLNPATSTSATVAFPSATPAIASLASSGAGTSSIVLGDATLGSPTTLTIGGNNNSTAYGGSLTDGVGSNPAAVGSLIKVGVGTLGLSGANNYTGTTLVSAGTLTFVTQAALYNNTPGSWTAANITVASGAALGLGVGGAGQFVSSDLDAILALGTATNGFTSGSSAAIDTAGGDFTYATAIANPNGGANVLNLVKAGANTLTLTGASTNTGTTTVNAGVLQIGAGGLTGALGSGSITDNATLAFNRSNAISVGNTITGTGTLAQTGTGSLTLTGTVSVGSVLSHFGAMIIDSGANVTATNFISIGNQTGDSGTLTVQGTGQLTVTTGAGDLNVSDLSGSTGVLNVTGGTVTAANLWVGKNFFNAPTGGTGTVNQSGGLVTVTGANGMVLAQNTASVGTYNLNGGTLSVQRISQDIGTSGTFNFNGGNLLAAASNANFMGGLTAANVQAGGAKVDDGGFAITVAQSLVHDPALGAVADGGLIKSGAGTLTLTGASTYTGGTTVTNGTLSLNGANTGTGVIRGVVTVNTGATLQLASTNALGFNAGVKVDTVNVVGGLVDDTATFDQGFNQVYDLTGGVMRSNGGVSAANAAQWFAMGPGSAVNSLANAASSTVAGRVILRADAAPNNVTFTVADGAAAVDLQLSAAITPTASPLFPAGITKAGSGLMVVGGANTYIGPTTIAAGTLSAATIVVSGGASNLGNATSAVILGDATTKGTLEYTGNGATYTRGFEVHAGGGQINTTTGGQTLTIATGAVTSSSDTNLTVGGAGNTTITANVGLGATSGALTKVGNGTLNINGGSQTYKTLTTTAGAGVTNVNTAIGTGTTAVVANAAINFGTVSQTFDSLSIGAGAVVTFTDGPATFDFGDGSSTLTSAAVVPEPGAIALLLTGGVTLAMRRRRQALAAKN